MNNNIGFFQLDPRPVGAESNEKFFSEHSDVLGIEVTLPAYASKCNLGNLDHHGPDDTAETPSACMQAFWMNFATQITAMVTVRPDADSITAMAVIVNKMEGHLVDESLVKEIDAFDRLGPAVGEVSSVVTAIARKACDFRLSLDERVRWVSEILAGDGKEEEVAELVSARAAEIKAAREASFLSVVDDGRMATIISTHRFATNLGYENATVVVAQNPEMPVDFRDPSKGTYRKYTICRYDSHVQCDLPAALKELQKLEEGWGGRGDIFGSPQGVSSKLTFSEVVEIVSRHLK